jgi:hypothetical protein
LIGENMGYYIQGPAHGKADMIVQEHGGRILASTPRSLSEVEDEEAIICVVDNGPFEAAGYAYSDDELRAFQEPSDFRPKTWVVMDKEKAEELSGFRR